jgi:hypothetical protein
MNEQLAKDLEVTWAKSDSTPRVDAKRLRKKKKNSELPSGAVVNRPRVNIRYRVDYEKRVLREKERTEKAKRTA